MRTMQVIYDTSDARGHNRISRLFSRDVVRVAKRRKWKAMQRKSRCDDKFSRFSSASIYAPTYSSRHCLVTLKDAYRSESIFFVIYDQLEKCARTFKTRDEQQR